MGEFCFGQSVRKSPENLEQVLFDETYFEQSNIEWRPPIWAQDKIITTFCKKKNGRAWFGAKCTKTAQKLKKIVTLRNLPGRELYQPETPLTWSQDKITTTFR